MSTLAETPTTGTITSDQVTVKPMTPAQLDEQAALDLVRKDRARGEQYLSQEQWKTHWREIDILYQSPRSLQVFEGSSTQRANVSRFTVAKHTNALVPTVMSGVFYDSPPFILRPRPGTSQNTVRAKTAIFGALLDEIEFKRECEAGIQSQTLNGTGVWKYGWTVRTEIQEHYVRKNSPIEVSVPFNGKKQVHTTESDEFEVEEREVTRSRPFFEYCPLGTVLVDPGWHHPNQIWRSKWVIHVQYPTFNDLDDLRGQEGYDIPSTEDLKKLFFQPKEVPVADGDVAKQLSGPSVVHHADPRDMASTEDPLEQPLRLDERWDKNRVITVLNDKLVIRNEAHRLRKIPFLSANWWDIQNAGFGLGIGRLVGTDQRVEAGTMNAAIDILSMAVNQNYVRSRGANVPTQQIRSRLGGIIDVDGDVNKAFAILETPKVPAEVWTTIMATKQASESVSGADEAMVQGNIPGKGSSIVRSATGAGNVAAASATRIQGPVGRFVDNVFIPFLVAMDEMIKERMPVTEIREILQEELGDAYVEDMDNFLNARLKYEVLAGAHLAAKKAMAQSLPLMLQIFENPHLVQQLNQTGWTVDVREIFNMFMEISEWKNTRQVIRAMTPQEAKMFAALTNPQAQKAQQDVEKIKAKHEARTEEIDQVAEAKLAEKLMMDASARAAGYVERVEMERAMEPRAFGKADEGQFNTSGAE